MSRRINPAYWFLAPALSVIVIFFFVPVAASVVLSLTDFDIYAVASRTDLRFVGPDNYLRLVHEPLFWVALKNTLYFVLIGGPLSVGVSLALAVLLSAKVVRCRGILRTIFFLPVVTTLVAIAIVFRYVYHPRFGLLNYGLSFLGIGPIDWLGDPHWAMPAIILMAVWKNFGFNMVIFIAGLQSIPDRLYEAAGIDGAHSWAQFRYVTLPMLAPTFLFVAVMTMIGYFQLFAEPYVMTQGGPAHSTLSIVLLMYQEGFRWWNMGYAAAVAFVLFAMILSLTLVAMRVRAREPAAPAVRDPRFPAESVDGPRDSPLRRGSGQASRRRQKMAAPQGERKNVFHFESHESCTVRAEALEARSSRLSKVSVAPKALR